MDRLNTRVSGRRAKKKAFDDYVPTISWTTSGGKRKACDEVHNEINSKYPKRETQICQLNKEDISCIPNDDGANSVSSNFYYEENAIKITTKKHEVTEACSVNDFMEVLASSNTEKHSLKAKSDVMTNHKQDLDLINSHEDSEKTDSDTSQSKHFNTKRVTVKETKKRSMKSQSTSENNHVNKNLRNMLKSTYPKRARSIRTSDYVAKNDKTNETCSSDACKKAGCRKKNLSCCIKASMNCYEVCGKTARWYHLSKEEHYCNGCFELFYRERNYTCEKMHEWKRAWAQNSRADPNFKNVAMYIAERQLPFWVQCTACGHWRALTNEVELTPKIVKMYRCSMGNLANAVESEVEENGYVYRRAPLVKYSCSKSNETCVETAFERKSNWMVLLNYTPFLKNSPAAPFLTGYYPDGVGMSAVDTNNCRDLNEFTRSDEDDDVIRPVEILKKIIKVKKNVELHKSNKSTDLSNQSSMMTSPGGRKRVYKETSAPVEGLNPYFQPFYKPHERGKALCMRPDVMELDEAEEFPSYYKDQTVYLAIRNLIISLWCFNPRRILTVERCCQHLLLRGLTRVRLCTIDVPQILNFAVRKGLVNLGAIKRPLSKPLKDSSAFLCHAGTLPPEYSDQKVIVIGAGPAGLGAARQLHNFGCDVTCLEARDRIGGRVHDDWSLDGVCVGKGAQIINGCINNPLALISHQLGLQMHILQPRCDLFDGKKEGRGKKRVPTKAVSSQFDKRMDFHFNALLDIIVEWRQAQAQDAIDCSLGEKIQEAHQEWMKQSGLSFSELEERLLNFHIGNLEFACGASLDQVSAFHWDQNEIFSQFSGDHTFVQYGFGTLLAALADGLDIEFDSPVSEVIKYDDGVQVKTENGNEYTADRVLITVPLAVLRSGAIRFEPELPVEKQLAMDRLGCGCIEKIALLFPHRFWGKKIEGANYFGYVPSQSNKKGFFSVFYDVPYPKCEKSSVLMSVISGEAVEESRRLTNEEVLDIALSILKDIFPEEKVPQPKSYFVTRWRDDPYAQMAYSFVKRGSSGSDYDQVAKEIDDKIFFAGEGSNRHFPQTVTGAYLSGVREASKIACANKARQTIADDLVEVA